MEAVGVREFRDRLARYLAESDEPLAITRHGDTIGYYLPARPKRTAAQKRAFKKAQERLQKVLQEKGLDEEQLVANFKLWRAGHGG